ncbi:FCD domain-containing protein [Streptomyces sp. SID4919]|nr:FCD domain-containing protein [Streptomyces sp. SID4919]SCK52524.1 DNA-binding transcriptional regulator, GntR family [Streptomyces sp. AmelKG-E11A]
MTRPGPLPAPGSTGPAPAGGDRACPPPGRAPRPLGPPEAPWCPVGGDTRVPPQPRPQPDPRSRPAPQPDPQAADTPRAAPVPPPAREPATGTVPARGEHTHGEPPLPRRPRPVVRASVRGQVLAALRVALVEGELAPGAVYSAPVLGERLGVSATPVREAMQQLAAEGAVEVVPNRGFRVVERSERQLAELAEVRALIEVPVMLRLTQSVSAARWAELRPLAEATAVAAACGDRAAYAESDRAFHRALLGLSGNQQLVQVADDLHRRAQWPLISGPLPMRRADLVSDAAEHSALLDALTARDATKVQSLVRNHFAGT